MKNTSVIMAVAVITMFPVSVYGQMELRGERNSIHGLKGVGFVVNLEQNTAFADSSLVKIDTITEAGKTILKKNHIRLFSREEVRKSVRVPVLYMHINMLSTSSGIISFAVNVNLIQPVKLMLHNGKRTTATTWQDGIVGIATYDKISVIKQAAMSLVRSFVSAYKQANSKQ